MFPVSLAQLTLVASAHAARFYSVTVKSLQPEPTTAGASIPADKVWHPFAGPASDFPPSSTWTNFDALFEGSRYEMSQWPHNAEYIGCIRAGVLKVSEESGIDPRVLLAVIMQESEGQVNAPTTYGGNPSTGIMQAYSGSTFDPRDPQGSITTMIRDGASGNGNTPVCLANYINEFGNYWDALAVYNQGTLGANFDDLADPASVGTADYVPSIANRLQGWLPEFARGAMPQDPGSSPASYLLTAPAESAATAVIPLPSASQLPAAPFGNVSWAETSAGHFTDPLWAVTVTAYYTDPLWAVTDMAYDTDPEWDVSITAHLSPAVTNTMQNNRTRKW